MAEFLIKAKRHWTYKNLMTAAEQAAYDKQYQIGDIVEVFPDGKLSDFATAGGKFFVVRVAGLKYEDAKKYHEQINEVTGTGTSTKISMVKRRKFRIRVADVPAVVKNALQEKGVYETTFDAIKTYIRNNITETDET